MLFRSLDPSKLLGDKVGGFLKTGFTKVLGPVMSAISGISSIYGTIQEGKAKLAAGEAVDFGAVGKKLVQGAAYPIASTLLTSTGIGGIVSGLDAVGGMLGFSPLKWITDNLIDLIPNEGFTGLGKFALGVEGEGAQPQTAQPVVEGGMNETVKVRIK